MKRSEKAESCFAAAGSDEESSGEHRCQDAKEDRGLDQLLRKEQRRQSAQGDGGEAVLGDVLFDPVDHGVDSR